MNDNFIASFNSVWYGIVLAMTESDLSWAEYYAQEAMQLMNEGVKMRDLMMDEMLILVAYLE